MKNLILISLMLVSLSSYAQFEKSSSDTTTTSQSTRTDIKFFNSLPYQVQKTKSPRRLGFFDEITAAASGGVQQVNSISPTAGNVNITFANLLSKPTTISGFGITDGVSTGGSYTNPSWLVSIPFSKLTTTPTTRSGYGITDAEGTITTGTTTQYFRGDKTFQTLDKTAVGLPNLTNALQVINAGGLISEGAGTLASRPTAGTAGRRYTATDTFAEYFDNGTSWGVLQPAITGDISIAAGATASILATVNGNVGTFGSTSTVPVVTYDAKGRATGVTTATITPSSIGAADATAVVPYSSVSTYAGLSGVTAPASGFLKFVMVTTDAQYTDSNTLYMITSAGKIRKLALLPSEN